MLDLIFDYRFIIDVLCGIFFISSWYKGDKIGMFLFFVLIYISYMTLRY